jgi:hypothetical protein
MRSRDENIVRGQNSRTLDDNHVVGITTYVEAPSLLFMTRTGTIVSWPRKTARTRAS